VDVVIEIPAWSFRKAHYQDGEFQEQFVSALPCPFNYGFAPGTMTEEGDPLDVIVIGPRLRQGDMVGVTPSLRVEFLDRGRRDDKMVARLDGAPLTPWDHLVLRVFFCLYVPLKWMIDLIQGARGPTGVVAYRPL